jgi:outer membrane protein TolC
MDKIILISACLFLFAGPGFSQSPARDTILTWPDCVERALHKNPGLTSAKYATEADRSAYYGSFNGLYPQLNLEESYNHPGKSLNGSNWQTLGSINFNLFNMSEVAKIKTSKSLISQALANDWQTSALLRLNLRVAFAQLLFAQKDI